MDDQKAPPTAENGPHDWVPSTLGHGETMCRACFITNREAAALGLLTTCEEAKK